MVLESHAGKAVCFRDAGVGWDDMEAALAMHEHVIKTWVADGDTVSVNGEEAGSSKISGKHYRAKWCWVFTVREGKIAV